MAGVTVPAVGPRNRLRRDHRQLEPLWRDLTSFAPEVKFEARPARRADITDRLRQRLTEINDVLVGPLQAYLDPTVYSAVREGGPQTLWNMVEAAHEQWIDLGEPAWHRFGITATPAEQRVWLDTPDSDHTWLTRSVI